jgi:hypothetical protein
VPISEYLLNVQAESRVHRPEPVCILHTNIQYWGLDLLCVSPFWTIAEGLEALANSDITTSFLEITF